VALGKHLDVLAQLLDLRQAHDLPPLVLNLEPVHFRVPLVRTHAVTDLGAGDRGEFL
jgi:hypothetical protein